MRILVAGAAGFIGSHVAAALLDDGHEVIGLDCFLPNLYPADQKRLRIAELVERPSFDFDEVDLRLTDVLPSLDGVDAIINEAAMPGLSASWLDYQVYQDCNLLVVQRILDAMRVQPGVHLVQISTSSVYGRKAVTDESGETRPISPYGVTKLAAEHLIAAYREEFNVSASVLRYFSVYGPGQRPDMAFSRFCQDLIQGNPLRITGDGSHTRSITYVTDVAEATRLAAVARSDGTVLNIAGSWEIGLLDAIDILADEIGERPQLEFVPARPGDQQRTAGVAAKAARELDWIARVAPEEGLRWQARAAIEANRNAIGS